MAHGTHHIIPIRTLTIVFLALVLLTVITVITAQMDFGPLNVPLAIVIASTKALLVATIFMALKYDNPVNTVVISLGCIFAMVFLLITLSDTALRGTLGLQPSGHIPYVVEDATHSEEEDPEPPEEPPIVTVRTGEELYTQYCVTCHSLDGTVLPGPTFQGIGDAQTREQITQSILEPDAVLVEGFVGQMMMATLTAFRFYDEVSDEEMEALIDFLQEQ